MRVVGGREMTTPLVFPPSATCLWDDRPAGVRVETCVDGQSWVCVRLSQSVLQLAVRASRQARSSHLSCLLLGSASISGRHGVVVEVDRLDLGRNVGNCLQPTALVPGDVIVYCRVCSGKSISVPEPLAEKQLLKRLETSVLSPPSLLHLQLHIATLAADSANPEPLVSLTCCCVYPGACTLTPVNAIPIVPTALAQNLAGPHPLSVLQASVKWGYLTMEITRKLVLLLNSDPKSQDVPLVGVWVSGVSSCTHPAVWATLLHYKHSKQLTKRAGKGSLCLVYSPSSRPTLFHFDHHIEDNFTYSTAQLEIELCSQSRPPLLELVPLHSPTFSNEQVPPCHHHLSVSEHRTTPPEPCPLPTLAKVSQLSTVSFLEKSLQGSLDLCPRTTFELKPAAKSDTSNGTQRLTVFPEKILQSSDKQPQKHSELTIPFQTPAMAEKGTNTGLSLLLLQNANPDPSAHDGQLGSASPSVNSTVTGVEHSVAIGELSLKTENSVPGASSINLDLCSFASSLQNNSEESVSTATENNCVLNSRQFYQNMLESVQELLQTPVEKEEARRVAHGNQGESEYKVHPELSILPIPQIRALVTTCSEATLDETTRAADVITMKYVNSHSADTTDVESGSYLQLPCHPDNHIVLDLGRLRSLPKLL